MGAARSTVARELSKRKESTKKELRERFSWTRPEDIILEGAPVAADEDAEVKVAGEQVPDADAGKP